MDITKPFKIARKAVSKVVDAVKEATKEVEASDKLHHWQKKLQAAQAQYDVSKMDEREYLYLGMRNVDRNINSRQQPTKYANNVNNIIFEFIESQVDSTIPQPSVKSKRPEFAHLASMIEDSITNDLPELGIEEINDYNERITPVQGFSIIEVAWNPDYKHHLYRGEIELYTRHPKQLIPQPGVYKLQKMDYFFVLSTVTKEFVKRRYGKDLETEEESHTDNTRLYGNRDANGQFNPDNETLTEVVCWYKDEDGDICKYVWINDVELEDLPKFFRRRVDGVIQNTQILEVDTVIGSGEVLPAGTPIPYFCPTRYPIVIRKNVPKNFAFEGQSDVDVIRDQQDSIKKIATKLEEKIVKGGNIITIPEDLMFNITDETYQIVKATPAQAQAIQRIELTANLDKDFAYLEQQYNIAQSMLGITDAYMGKEDATAKSGIAKQIQVQQASGRLQSKQFNKYAAFKELFEIMFEFKLAFYDELRPYVAKDKDGRDMFQNFDKYTFLVRDAAGELYYNTDFMFFADAGQGLPKDKIFIFNQAKEMLATQAIDVMQFWTIMESLNFPMAKQIKTQIEDKMQQQQQMAMMQAEQEAMQQMAAQNQPESFDEVVGSLPGPVQEMYKKLPPEAKAEVMRQASG